MLKYVHKEMSKETQVIWKERDERRTKALEINAITLNETKIGWEHLKAEAVKTVAELLAQNFQYLHHHFFRIARIWPNDQSTLSIHYLARETTKKILVSGNHSFFRSPYRYISFENDTD